MLSARRSSRIAGRSGRVAIRNCTSGTVDSPPFIIHQAATLAKYGAYVFLVAGALLCRTLRAADNNCQENRGHDKDAGLLPDLLGCEGGQTLAGDRQVRHGIPLRGIAAGG